VTKQYPKFSGEVNKAYLLMQYQNALNQNIDLSLSDVAYLVNQRLSEADIKVQAVREDNKNKQTVKAKPASSNKKTIMSFEEIKKLGGLM
jgi:hypothetical protein